MKTRVRLVLVAATLASIATSVARPSVSSTTDLPLVVADNDVSVVRYRIYAGVMATDLDMLDGDAVADLTLKLATGALDEKLTVHLRSLATADFDDTFTPTVDATGSSLAVRIPAWTACTASPCSEDYELTITRQPGPSHTPLTISGTFEVSAATGDDKQVAPTVVIGPPELLSTASAR